MRGMFEKQGTLIKIIIRKIVATIEKVKVNRDSLKWKI